MSKTIRHSKQRDRIYQYLIDTNNHPSAEMIYTALREDLPELSLGTVYRNLKLLEELGRVRRVTNLHGNERYDAICGDHIHFLCKGCGTITDLCGTDSRKILEEIPNGEGYQFSRLDMMITGHCPQCKECSESFI